MTLCYWLSCSWTLPVWCWMHRVWRCLYPKRTYRRCRTRARNAPARRFRPARLRRSGGRPKPPWVVEAVVQMYAGGGKSYRNVMNEFNRLHAHDGMTVCLNTVHAWVQKYCSEMEEIRRATRNRFPHYAPANLRWCLDGAGKEDATGVQHFILSILDHGTRRSLALVRLAQENAEAILERIALAAKQFGTPKIIRTDNAPVFRSAVFAQGMAALGIRHEFTEPGKPWQNGRAERLFLTLKEKLNEIVPENGAMLDSLLGEFSFWYNTIRPHQHLHGFTPMEVWNGIDPYKSAPKAVLHFEGWDGMLKGFYLQR